MIDIIYGPFRSLINDRSITFDIIFFSFLLILLPIVLITGPALPDIFLSLIALYFLVISIFKKLWNYYQNPIVTGFLLFCAYSLFRSFFSEAPFLSLTNEGSMFYFRYIFFAMGVWYLLDNNRYLTKCLLFISIITLIFTSFDGFFQYIFETNIFGNEKYNDHRLTGVMGNEPILGRYLSFLSMLTFVLIYLCFPESKKIILFSILLLMVAEIVIFLTGERAPLLSIVFFSILILVFAPYLRIYRLLSILISVVIIFGILQINPTAKKRMIDNTMQELGDKKFATFLPYGYHHEEHYISSFKMFKQNPLFGIGTNMFEFHCSNPKYIYKNSCAPHPHNFYIQVLAELGLVGFSFIFTFFLYLLFIGLKQLKLIILSNKKKQIPFSMFLLPLILFVFWWPVIPHMSLYNNWNNVLIMLPLGFFMKYFYGSRKNEHF